MKPKQGRCCMVTHTHVCRRSVLHTPAWVPWWACRCLSGWLSRLTGSLRPSASCVSGSVLQGGCRASVFYMVSSTCADRRAVCCVQFKIEPFRHPLKMDPSYGGMQPCFCRVTAFVGLSATP